jgi:hypothetical protein
VGNPPSLDQHDVDIAAACRVEQALAGFSLRRPGANLPHLLWQWASPAGRRIPASPVLHGEGLLIVGGHAGVEASSTHFRLLPCLAEDLA